MTETAILDDFSIGWHHEVEKARQWLRSQGLVVLALKAAELLKAPDPASVKRPSYVAGRREARARVAAWLDERGHHTLAASIRDLEHKGMR